MIKTLNRKAGQSGSGVISTRGRWLTIAGFTAVVLVLGVFGYAAATPFEIMNRC